MTVRSLKALVLGLVASLPAGAAFAHSYQAGNLTIQHPWSRETAVGQSVGGGFLTVINAGNTEDRLLSGTSPIAAEVQLHTMTMDHGVMRMRQVTNGIAIPPKGTVQLQPGGYHIMFIGLSHPLHTGERVPVTLHFRRVGDVKVEFAVQQVSSTGPTEGGHVGH